MISVCMATYNGEKYIFEQIESILAQLTPDDEVIIVDDFSTDDTVKILQGINDSRIKIYLNDRNRGHVFSFARAISLASNEIIFLADQDDIWLAGRVSLMARKLLDTGAQLVSSNYELIDRHGVPLNRAIKIELKSEDSSKYIRNILKIFMGTANYFGSAMAFRKDIVPLILPIPSFVILHDVWISLAGNLIGSNVHLDERTLKRRLHDNNFTNPNRSIFTKIKYRFIFGLSIIVLLSRYGRARYGWAKQ